MTSSVPEFDPFAGLIDLRTKQVIRCGWTHEAVQRFLGNSDKLKPRGRKYPGRFYALYNYMRVINAENTEVQGLG